MGTKGFAVFGASGRTGQAVIGAALRAGFGIRAFARPGALIEAPDGVTILRGSLESPADVRDALSGVGGVCCVFGPRPPYTDVFCARATEVIVQQMAARGLRRLVCLTGAAVGDLPSNVSRPMQGMARLFRRQRPAVAADSAEQERIVMASGLDWTIVKPPRLTDRASSRPLRCGTGLRVGLLSQAGRPALAEFMIELLAHAGHVGERVYVST